MQNSSFRAPDDVPPQLQLTFWAVILILGTTWSENATVLFGSNTQYYWYTYFLQVEEYVRILYGFYVEGAMALLACALATMRSHGSTTINYMSEKYRLFTINKQQ